MANRQVPAQILDLLHADPKKVKALSAEQYKQVRDLLAQTASVGVEELDAMREGKKRT